MVSHIINTVMTIIQVHDYDYRVDHWTSPNPAARGCTHNTAKRGILPQHWPKVSGASFSRATCDNDVLTNREYYSCHSWPLLS